MSDFLKFEISLPKEDEMFQVLCKKIGLAIILIAFVSQLSVLSTTANEFKWASTTDPQTMDPHAVNTAPVLGFLNNIYEGLVRRDTGMRIEGALAESWEPIGTDGWRFNLRKGVKFHDGSDFDAEDVLFSYERATSEKSDVQSWFAPVEKVEVVDQYTVDFLTINPNPIFPDSIANFMIMDKGWTESNGAAQPASETETYATLNANGTGAFKLAEREPGVETVLVPHENWWDQADHNITRAIFVPISNQATAVAALLSGEVDFVNPLPIQDVPRLREQSGINVLEGIEARVIMIGFPHQADQLIGGDGSINVNPFQDLTVRQVIYNAIDVDLLVDKIMRGNAEPVSLLVSQQMRGASSKFANRQAADESSVPELLRNAGYPNGFKFRFVCPNDRYINDEAICKAITTMFAKHGIEAELQTMPVRNYWPELREGNFDMYLLGWSPGTFDAEHPIRFLLSTPNAEKKLGSWNFGGYSNSRIDELLPQIQREIDDQKRQAMLDEVHEIMQDEVAYVPLYVQPLVWGTKENIDVVQRADNFFILRWVQVN